MLKVMTLFCCLPLLFFKTEIKERKEVKITRETTLMLIPLFLLGDVDGMCFYVVKLGCKQQKKSQDNPLIIWKKFD